MESGNKGLRKANKEKKDEFYTQLKDIELELKHYKDYFENKVVLCNCDDPYESNFFKFFAMNFNNYKLKKLIATCYKHSPIANKQLNLFDFVDEKEDCDCSVVAHKVEITEVSDYNNDGSINLLDVAYLLKNNKNNITVLRDGGDFRSNECIEILKEADIVVTNPPFSLFREYVAQLVKYKKHFIIIGNVNALTYREIYSLVKNELLWLGVSIHSGDREFQVPDYYPLNASGVRVDKKGNKFIRVKGVRWFTNIDNKYRYNDLILYKEYIPENYPKYVNFDAINIDLTKHIPIDYDGIMGVPITFMDKYNPKQFTIVGLGIVGSCEFSNNKRMEILKNGTPTGKYTYNAKGTLYRKYNHNKDKNPAFKDCETGELYSSIYARVLIKRK